MIEPAQQIVVNHYMSSDVQRTDAIDAARARPLRSNSKSQVSRSQSPLVNRVNSITSPSYDASGRVHTNSEQSVSPTRRIISDLKVPPSDFQHFTKGNHLLPLQPPSSGPTNKNGGDYNSNIYVVTTNNGHHNYNSQALHSPSYYHTENAMA